MITIAHDPEIRTDAADGGDAAEVYRFDRGGVELLQSRRQDDGSWLLQGVAAVAGILTYQRNGQTVRELVTPEVLKASMPSLERRTVTLEHPEPIPTMITSANARRYWVGDVGGDSEAPAVTWDDEGGRLIVSVCVRTDDAIAAIQNGKHELSIGYKVPRLDKTPGVHPVYGAYDVQQLERRNNHVAITDTARAGHGAMLRVDSAGHLTSETMMDPKLLALLTLLGWRTDNADAAIAEAPAKIAEMKAAMPAEGQTRLAAAEAKVAELTAALTVATTELEAAKAAGTVDAVTSEIGAAMDATPPADLAAAPPAAQRMDSIRRAVLTRSTERAKLERVAGDLRVDAAEVAKLGDVELRKKIVLVAYPEARTDAADAYYAARLDILAEGAARVDAVDPTSPYADMNRRASQALADADAASRRTDRADAPKKPLSMAAQSLAQSRANLHGTSEA